MDNGADGAPAVEPKNLLDYKTIDESLSQDLDEERETLGIEIDQWESLREDLARWELQAKKYRVDLSTHAKYLISDKRELKQLDSDWNDLKSMLTELAEPIVEIQKRVEAIRGDLLRVEEKITLNKSYSTEVITSLNPSHWDVTRLRKNFKALDHVYEKRKQNLSALLEDHEKILTDMLAIKKDHGEISEKYGQEVADRKREILFEREMSPFGSISLALIMGEISALYQRTLVTVAAYVGQAKELGGFPMNMVVFATLLSIWMIALIRLKSFWNELLKRDWFGLGEPQEYFALMVRRSMIPMGLAAYFFLYGLMEQPALSRSVLIVFYRLIMAYLFIDWVLFFMEVPGKARIYLNDRRLMLWKSFLRGLFPVVALNLIFDLVYVHNHIIPVLLRLFMGCYLLAGFFVITFRLSFPVAVEGEAVVSPVVLKLVVGGGKVILLAGLLMELFGYGALSIYWYLSWVYSVVIFIWSWHLFRLLIDFRLRQKEEVNRDPYFSQVLSHGHPVKWALLQVGWCAWALLSLVLVVLAWSKEWGMVVNLFTFLHHPIIIGSLSFSIMNLFYAVLTVGGTHMVTRLWKHVLLTKILVDSGFEKSAQNSISMITVYTMWLFGILLALHVFGLGTTSLTVAFGALGIGLGFGLQTIFNNFISGIILLFERPIQVGDDIEINGTWANVRKINVRSTIVQTYDNASLIIPNSEFVSSQVTNWTFRDKRIRRKIKVGVAYGSDVQLVRDSLLEIAKPGDNILAYPKPDVLFADFGDSSLSFVLRFWTNVDIMLTVETDLRFEIDRVFREKGIVMAFPQLDVHMDVVKS